MCGINFLNPPKSEKSTVMCFNPLMCINLFMRGMNVTLCVINHHPSPVYVVGKITHLHKVYKSRQ